MSKRNPSASRAGDLHDDLADLAARDETFRKWRKSVTKREEEILFESLAKYYPDIAENMDADRLARGEASIEDPKKVEKWRTDYEKAYYGKLRRSEKRRHAVDFLRRWRVARILERERDCALSLSDGIALLEPLLDALPSRENPDRLDIEFFEGLLQAAKMLQERLLSCKQAHIGSGDLHLDKWLLEYSLGIPRTGQHTARELNEQFVSKFCSISDKELRERCRKLGVPLKPDRRGRAAVRYGSSFQMAPSQKKKG
jgi:hypothetical protein